MKHTYYSIQPRDYLYSGRQKAPLRFRCACALCSYIKWKLEVEGVCLLWHIREICGLDPNTGRYWHPWQINTRNTGQKDKIQLGIVTRAKN